MGGVCSETETNAEKDAITLICSGRGFSPGFIPSRFGGVAPLCLAKDGLWAAFLTNNSVFLGSRMTEIAPRQCLNCPKPALEGAVLCARCIANEATEAQSDDPADDTQMELLLI